MKKQLGKRMMSVVLLVCILVGILPTGISATEGAVDSVARGSTLSQEAQNLRTEINDLSTPQYTSVHPQRKAPLGYRRQLGL